MEEITFLKGLTCLLLWGLVYLVICPASRFPYRLSKPGRVLGFILILLFCLYPYWGGDYFHSMHSFEDIKAGEYNHFEDIYGWIISWAPSYTLYRFIVWGTALSILFIAYKRVGNNFDLSLFYFGALYMQRFSYARASLAMAIILFGMTIIYKPFKKHKFLSYFLGALVICCSEFFHRSALVGILSAFGTLTLIKNSRKKILLLFVFVPFSATLVSYMLGNMLDMSFEAIDASIDGKLERYTSGESGERGIASRISMILQNIPMYLSVLAFLILTIKNKIEKFTMIERSFAYYMFIIMLIVIGLSMDIGYNTDVIALRVMCFAMPANAVFLMSMKTYKNDSRLFYVIYYMALASCIYALMYATYMGYNRSF